MKKVIYLLLIFMCFLFVTTVKVATNVTITDISVDSKSETIEVNSYSASGLNINSDVYFNQVGDYVKYRVVLPSHQTA